MSLKMQAGYRALEHGQYADAAKRFTDARKEYEICVLSDAAASLPEDYFWAAYAVAGLAATAFGDNNIAAGLKQVGEAKYMFSGLVNGTSPWAQGETEGLRRSASEGLAYVRSLESAQKPLLPKVWLDWKAAHP
jgi:hypothetical protein